MLQKLQRKKKLLFFLFFAQWEEKGGRILKTFFLPLIYFRNCRESKFGKRRRVRKLKDFSYFFVQQERERERKRNLIKIPIFFS